MAAEGLSAEVTQLKEQVGLPPGILYAYHCWIRDSDQSSKTSIKIECATGTRHESYCAAQLASATGEALLLQAAKQGLSEELERIKGENRGLLQKAALLESLSAEAEALRQQVSKRSCLSHVPGKLKPAPKPRPDACCRRRPCWRA